jgi:hypothetical protein
MIYLKIRSKYSSNHRPSHVLKVPATSRCPQEGLLLIHFLVQREKGFRLIVGLVDGQTLEVTTVPPGRVPLREALLLGELPFMRRIVFFLLSPFIVGFLRKVSLK